MVRGAKGSVRRNLKQESAKSLSRKDCMCPCCCPVHPPRSHPTQTLKAKSQHPTDPRARTQLLQKEWESVSLACLEGAQYGDRGLPGHHLLAALHAKMDSGTFLITPRCQDGCRGAAHFECFSAPPPQPLLPWFANKVGLLGALVCPCVY